MSEIATLEQNRTALRQEKWRQVVEAKLGDTLASISVFSQGLPEKVLNVNQYETVADLRRLAKKTEKEVAALQKELLIPIRVAETELKTFLAGICLPILDAIEKAEKLMRAWDAEREAERRRKQAEVDAEMARRAAEEKQKLEAAALAALKKGKEEAAKIALVQAAAVKPVEIKLAPEKITAPGTSYRSVWKFEIEDPFAVPLEYLQPNEKKIGEFVRFAKEKAQIPGVRVWEEKILVQK